MKSNQIKIDQNVPGIVEQYWLKQINEDSGCSRAKALESYEECLQELGRRLARNDPDSADTYNLFCAVAYADGFKNNAEDFWLKMDDLLSACAVSNFCDCGSDKDLDELLSDHEAGQNYASALAHRARGRELLTRPEIARRFIDVEAALNESMGILFATGETPQVESAEVSRLITALEGIAPFCFVPLDIEAMQKNEGTSIAAIDSSEKSYASFSSAYFQLGFLFKKVGSAIDCFSDFRAQSEEIELGDEGDETDDCPF